MTVRVKCNIAIECTLIVIVIFSEHCRHFKLWKTNDNNLDFLKKENGYCEKSVLDNFLSYLMSNNYNHQVQFVADFFPLSYPCQM